MMPRTPSTGEQDELTEVVVQRLYPDATETAIAAVRDMVARAAIAVIDDYGTDGPGYRGFVMMVIWSDYPSFYDVYTYANGRLRLMDREAK